MEPMLMPTTNDLVSDSEEELLVHAWRTEQLRRLGLSHTLADRFADPVDWHTLAGLIERGCPAEIALEIVR